MIDIVEIISTFTILDKQAYGSVMRRLNIWICGIIIWHKLNFQASLVAQMVNNLPAELETQVESLGWEDPLEKEMATHKYSCLENSMDRGAWQSIVYEVAKSWT